MSSSIRSTSTTATLTTRTSTRTSSSPTASATLNSTTSSNTSHIYIGPDGTIYDVNAQLSGKVHLFGSSFQNPLSVTTLSVSALWMSCLFVIWIWLWIIWAKAPPGSKTRRYLRRLVMNLAVACTMLYYVLDVTNRIMQEQNMVVTVAYVVLPILTEGMLSTAHGLLMGFLLRQLMPALLHYAGYSTSQSISALKKFKWINGYIAIFDFAIFVLMSFSYASTINQVAETDAGVYMLIVDGVFWPIGGTKGLVSVLNAAFFGSYLLATLLFSRYVYKAYRALARGHDLDRNLRIYLPILTVSVILRTSLDLAWTIAFKTTTVFNQDWSHPQPFNTVNRAIEETVNFKLVHMILYGLFTVPIFVSILYIAKVQDEDRDAQVEYHLVEVVQSGK